MNTRKKNKILIIGAGIIGLSTATVVQNVVPECEVVVAADKFLTDTTSDGAAGIFRPGLNFGGPNEDVSLKWLRDSYEYYNALIKTKTWEEARSIGLSRIRVLHVATKDPNVTRNRFIERLLDDYRELSDGEIRSLVKGEYIYGTTYSTTVTECRKYLPYLTKEFEKRGGKIINRSFGTFDDVPVGFDLVFNCSGFGAKDLCHDLKMTPIRGQVFKVKAPWVRDAVYIDTDTYVIPGSDGLVTLGGTRQFDSLREDVSKHDSADIWERCTAVLPSLKDAKVEREWVGFRPYRPEIRIEKEVVHLANGRKIMVIHNYGHGGYGVTSAPGTAIHAVGIATQVLGQKDFKAKL